MLRVFATTALLGLLCVPASHVYGEEETAGPAHQQFDATSAEPLSPGEVTEPDAGDTGTYSAEQVTKASAPVAKAANPSLVPNFINFGYIQFDHAIPTMRWNAMTHVGTAFVDFLSDGSLQNPGTFTGRNADLRVGGAAQAAGTKVILVVRNDNFDETVLANCMASSTARANLVNNVRNLVLNDAYCGGVNFDFEFSWTSSTRDGITAFMQSMRQALPNHELSVYTHAIYNSSRWNIAALEPTIDYMIYSTYDWGTSRAHAISDFNNCIPHMNAYINAGLPPHKMVLAWASYGRRWHGANIYDSAGNGTKNSQGFADSLYDTTLEPQFGGPFNSTYVTGDEAEWYTYNANGTDYTVTWDSPASLEMKIRAALSMPPGGTGTTHQGKRLGGVGWWSLGWLTNVNSSFSAQSYNPIAGALQSRARTYPHVYQLAEEILSAPGDKRFIFEGFEGLNPRWTDPNESPDTTGDTDNDSGVVLIAKPAGGQPNSTKAVRLTFDFDSTSNNRLFFRHEVLNDEGDTAVTDVHSAVCHVDATSAFIAPYHVAGNYSPRTIRMALLDGNRQIEVSPAIALPSTTGWHELQWDITDPSQIQAYNTNEPAFVDGNGVLNTAGNGTRDIRFLGFIIQGGGAGSGQISFDELAYEHRNPGGKQYVINEFRYSIAGEEFVEIHGPAGPFPTGLQLRFYNSSTGQVLSSVNLNGRSIPASGLFVVGDTGVPNTTGSNGFVPAGWGSGDNIPNIDPSAIQLYDTSNGSVYDSVTYEAMGGLDSLARQETHGVTGEGFGWVGEIGPGRNGTGQGYTAGRYPDGADTQVNQKDFSFMPPTPGVANGGSVPVGTTFNFDTAPAGILQTYQTPALVNPTSLGIPASPGGGNVWRVVDSAGGGVLGVIGDAALGSTSGYKVTGQIYIPAAAAPAQAVAVGFCGNGGSTFFASSPDSSGYESGYWLIYEHGTVNLADGQPNHSGSFQFLHATNDNMHRALSTALGSNRSLAQLGLSAGTWAAFELNINPAHATDKLVAKVNGVDVYRGAIPQGGPASGAFQAGFRETGGGVANNEGTFIDSISFQPTSPPAGPTSLDAQAAGTNVLITWNDSSTDEDGFVLERKRDDEAEFATITTLGANVVEYTDQQGLQSARQYCYRVKAYNDSGASSYSNTDCAVTENVSQDELIDEIAAPGAPGDLFGFSIARVVIGKQIGFVVGAPGAAHQNTSGAGKAYLFYPPSTEPALVLHNPEAPPASESNYFGHSVSAVGSSILVGAPGAESSGTGGRVYMFDGLTGSLQRSFAAPEADAGDRFGFSVSGLGKNDVVVGAPGSSQGTGKAYLFSLKFDTMATIEDFSPVPSGQFGYAIAGSKSRFGVVGLNGTCSRGGLDVLTKKAVPYTSTDEAFSVADANGKFVVGAPLQFDCNSTKPGYAYLLTGKKLAVTYQNPYESLDDGFGYSVAGGKKFVGVGAPDFDELGAENAGRAYLFRTKSSLPAAMYRNPSPASGDRFGHAMAISEKIKLPTKQKVNIAAVGAPYSDSNGTDSGAIYYFLMPVK